MFFDVFLNVLAVLGIIAVGAFVIVFLSDLLISIVDGSNGIFFKRAKNKDKVNIKQKPKLLTSSQSAEALSFEEEVKTEKSEEVFDGIDYEKAKIEEKEINRLVKPAPIAEAVVPTTKNADKELEDERMRLIRERRREFEKDFAPEPEVKDLKESLSERMMEIEIDKEFEKISKKAMEELELQESAANIKLEEDKVHYESEINSLKAQIENQKQKIVMLENVVSTKEGSAGEIVTIGSKEDIENRLLVLRQRLKDYEKEFSVSKKDFLPLKRVNDTLEADKKKLRRREAVVAKRKVQLYGVNNYIDIDEEKAKELAEELDLLEGLRLSVKHCEDVMTNNKDRYPVLERNYNILKLNIENLKQDIEDFEKQLAKIMND